MLSRKDFSRPSTPISLEDTNLVYPMILLPPPTIEGSRGRGKRRFEEKEKDDVNNDIALAKLESLLLDDDEDEDVLVLGSEMENDVLLELESDPSVEAKGAKGKTDEKTDAAGVSAPDAPDSAGVSAPNAAGVSAPGGDSGDDQSNCPMKWLRTVGLGANGSLRCTVTSGKGLDAGSETGQTITESLVADTIRNLINTYHKKRADVLDHGIVSTPLHVVKKMALQHDETLHLEVLGNPNGYNRVEIFSGIVRGVGEGTTKRVAAQMAAIDLLENVQLSGGTVKVPPFAFLPGWLTSNRVFTDLFALCKEKGLPRPRLTSKTNNLTDEGIVDPFLPPFKAECWVGDQYATVGYSENETFARREAAKEMYAVVSTVEYKDTPYAIGRSCRRATELAAAGCPLVMSDYKKLWLLQNRVRQSEIDIPKNEVGLEDITDLAELEKDLHNVEKMGYALMKKKKTMKITVRNKKMKMSESGEGDPAGESRIVAVEKKEEGEEDWY